MCCDVMNKGANLELACQHCGFTACANCYKRVFQDTTKPPAVRRCIAGLHAQRSLTRLPQCMSPECRKILSADNLLQAFSAAYVTTGLERARREALVRTDGGFDLLMQLHVFPRVHEFEARCAAFLAAKEELHKAELAAVELGNELFEFRKAVVMRDPSIAGGSTEPKAIRAAEREVENRVHDGRRALRTMTQAFDLAKARVHEAHRMITLQPLTGEVLAASDDGPAVAPRLFRCSAEACGGNYRSTDGICMVCQLRHCKRCAVALAEPVEGEPAHQCNPDDVASLKEIATSTRECPRCRALSLYCGCCLHALNARFSQIRASCAPPAATK